jgi:hypothetical protein
VGFQSRWRSVRRECSSLTIRDDGEGLLTVLHRIIFELIQGEMAYVKDLENIEYVRVKRDFRMSY